LVELLEGLLDGERRPGSSRSADTFEKRVEQLLADVARRRAVLPMSIPRFSGAGAGDLSR
jgi:hypothetical protein